MLKTVSFVLWSFVGGLLWSGLFGFVIITIPTLLSVKTIANFWPYLGLLLFVTFSSFVVYFPYRFLGKDVFVRLGFALVASIFFGYSLFSWNIVSIGKMILIMFLVDLLFCGEVVTKRYYGSLVWLVAIVFTSMAVNIVLDLNKYLSFSYFVILPGIMLIFTGSLAAAKLGVVAANYLANLIKADCYHSSWERAARKKIGKIKRDRRKLRELEKAG